MALTQRLDHRDFGPLYSEDSRILILGSFPSVKSREAKFYYGHPQNRFWRILRALDDPEIMKKVNDGESIDISDLDIAARAAMASRLHFALWDTIESCVITGSSDSSIRDVIVNDIPEILAAAPIRKIACNGTASYDLFMKYAYPEVLSYYQRINGVSPANTEIFAADISEFSEISVTYEVPEIIKLPSSSPANAAWSLKKLTAEWAAKLI